MNRDEFEELVREGIERLPKRVRKKIKNVAILIENEPSEEIRKLEKLGPDETLLGLYQGVPLTDKSYDASLTPPDTITLYRLSIEEAAMEDGKDVCDVIAETIWHEFAHHFGMDEAQVRKREDERDGESN